MSEELRSLEAIVGVAGPSFTVDREGRSVTVEYASRGFFDDIRPKLTLGRGFEAGEHVLGAEPVVVISDRYWRERYDRSLDVLGERVELFQRQLGGGTRPPTEFRIIGVMAPELRGLMIDDVDLWAPLERNIPFISGEAVTDYERARTEQYVRSLGRLRPGVTMTALRLEIDAWYAEYLEANGMPVDRRIDVVRGVVRDISVHRDAERQLKLFWPVAYCSRWQPAETPACSCSREHRAGGASLRFAYRSVPPSRDSQDSS